MNLYNHAELEWLLCKKTLPTVSADIYEQDSAVPNDCLLYELFALFTKKVLQNAFVNCVFHTVYLAHNSAY